MGAIKNQQEKMMTAERMLISDSGAPVTDNQNLRIAGPGGPILFDDHHLLEKTCALRCERIPESDPGIIPAILILVS